MDNEGVQCTVCLEHTRDIIVPHPGTVSPGQVCHVLCADCLNRIPTRVTRATTSAACPTCNTFFNVRDIRAVSITATGRFEELIWNGSDYIPRTLSQPQQQQPQQEPTAPPLPADHHMADDAMRNQRNSRRTRDQAHETDASTRFGQQFNRLQGQVDSMGLLHADFLQRQNRQAAQMEQVLADQQQMREEQQRQTDVLQQLVRTVEGLSIRGDATATATAGATAGAASGSGAPDDHPDVIQAWSDAAVKVKIAEANATAAFADQEASTMAQRALARSKHALAHSEAKSKFDLAQFEAECNAKTQALVNIYANNEVQQHVERHTLAAVLANLSAPAAAPHPPNQDFVEADADTTEWIRRRARQLGRF